MKLFVAFFALLAVSSASPLHLTTVPLTTSTQYHSQDGIGQYVYGYNDHLSAKQEIKLIDGITRGSYSYIDSNNILQTVDYVADAGGFRVVATNLPKPVEVPIVPSQDLPKQVLDTPEVAAAKYAHLAAIEKAKLGLGVTPTALPLVAPLQVLDTPEVAAAKVAHFAAVEVAKKQVGYPVVAIELPQPVKDTPEVAKAKAEHLIAIEQAKLRGSYQPVLDNGISLLQKAPLITPQQLPLVTSGSVPIHPLGLTYPSGVVPVSHLPYASHVKYLVRSL